MKKRYLDGNNNPLKEGWYLGVFVGSSNSTAAKAVRGLSFIRKAGQEYLAYFSKIPTRITPNYAKNLYPMDVRIYLGMLRERTGDVLGVVEKMIEEGVLPSELKDKINLTLNASEYTAGRGNWKAKP